MKPVDVARETLRRAVELQVLETDDVSAAGSLLQDPRELVDALKSEKFISDQVEAAFKRLVELRPPGGPQRPVTSAGGKIVGLSDKKFDTMAPQRGAGEPALQARASQPAPAPEVKAYEAAKAFLNPTPQTLAPSRELESSTKAPTKVSRDDGGGTIAPMDKPSAPSKVELADPGMGTLAPQRGAGEKARIQDGQRPGVPKAPSGESLIDLSILEPAHRRAIEAAAFCRIALRLGKATRDQVLEALQQPGNVEDVLLAKGVIDQPSAMEIVALRQSPRSACGNCFGVLPPNHPADKGCPICGQASTTSTGNRVSSATMAEGGAGGIEGFPGQGGMFAGYELLERIAEGGMGVVFKARQTKLNRVVALKVMRGGSLANKERRRRFRQEAEAAAALRHPCIVPVHEIDEVAGYPFYTMEFVEGITLDRYVVEKKLEPKKVTALVRGVADAVQHFHLRGIIHRDLKPGNILVGEDNVPKIIDFGIAKKLVPDSDSSTIEGEVLGTPYYMSPEQATGRITEVDTRTDVYALGTILYELLTGAPPWKGYRQARLIAAIQEEDPEAIRPKNPAVEVDLESIVMKSMAKERERRYQSAADLASDLERYEKNMPITARPASPIYRLKKFVRRRLPAVIASIVILFVLAAAGAVAAANAQEKHRQVAGLLSEAQNPALSIAEREAKLNTALGIDPGNGEAKATLGELAAKRLAEDERLKREQDKKEEASRLEKKTLEDRLARQDAERKANEMRTAEQARLDAEQKAKGAAEERAQKLLAEASGAGNPLDLVPIVAEALIVLPPGPSPLRVQIENRKIDLELGIARVQVSANQTGLARFWVGDVRRLESSKARQSEIDAIESDVKKLESGESELAEGHRLALAENWLAARAKLEQARALGVAKDRLAADLELVQQGCSQHAAQLLIEGRSLLAKGEAANGIAKATEALSFETSEAVKALVADCEAQLVLDARRQAADLFSRPEGQKSALVALDQAEERVQDPKLKASLHRERLARGRLIEERPLAGLCFVPEVGDLNVAAHYLEGTEVTNAAFKEFVDAGGYQNAELWKGVAPALIDTFKDGCPGGTCTHRAPRSWTNGGFGDPANADRPVRGVTAYEARAYALWKSKQTGARWRLPTDKEWEVAAGWDPQTSRLRLYPWGSSWDASAVTIGTDLPRPVGSQAGDRSALGVQDAAGNVMEWVERPGQNEPGTKGCCFAASEAVARHFAQVRSTGTPGLDPPPELLEWIGFRLVREIEDK